MIEPRAGYIYRVRSKGVPEDWNSPEYLDDLAEPIEEIVDEIMIINKIENNDVIGRTLHNFNPANEDDMGSVWNQALYLFESDYTYYELGQKEDFPEYFI